MTMTRKMLNLPPEAAYQVREASLGELGDAAADIATASSLAGRESHPEWFRGHVERFDQHRALLDAIGWEDPEPVEIDLAEHGRAFFAGLELLLETELYLARVSKENEGGNHQRRTAERHIEQIEACLASALVVIGI
ncbi:MAG: hypothetical protein ACLP04_06160 [Solirubrobacteraceae bacterium]